MKKIDFSNTSNSISDTSSSKEFNFSGLFEAIWLIWTKNEEEKVEEVKKSEDKINILLLWRWGWSHDAPNLTDSIIFVSIHKVHKTISMLSIPRDLYVKYDNSRAWKINEVYAISRQKTWENKDGIDALSSIITDITGEKLDYYVNIDFEGFSSFIDAIWWVVIDVPNILYDEEYPDWNFWYRTLIIKKWTWLFDWKTALMYARSRHSTSDFDRSLRQQQIITAVRDKLNEGWFLTKLYKVKNFYDVFIKYVETDLGLTWLVKVFNEINDGSDYEILSYNLNDSCFFWDPECLKWWFLYVPERALFWGSSILLPNWAYKWNIDNYEGFEKFMDLIFNNSSLYKEKLQINIFNSTKIRGIAWDIAIELKKYGFEVPDKDSIWNARDKVYNKSVIIYEGSKKDSATLSFLKDVLGIELVERELYTPVYSKDVNTSIEIILWNDYEEVLANLKDNL